MAQRCTPSDVEGIVTVRPDIPVTPFIRAAVRLTDKISANDSAGEMSAADLKEVEIYLAAHFYSHRVQLYQANSTDDASNTFQGKTDMGLKSTQYGQTAMILDTTGYLTRLGKGKIQFAWVGIEEQYELPDLEV